MRWLEYGQRLRKQRRGLLRTWEVEVASVVLDAATPGWGPAQGSPQMAGT